MCLFPKLIKNPKYKPNAKNGYTQLQPLDNRVLAVPIGCGQCIECRKKKAQEWQVRLLEDVRHNKNGKFITLTFSNESIKKIYKELKAKNEQEQWEAVLNDKPVPDTLTGYKLDNAAATLATRRFLERWRKKNKKSVRHWLVTELGHKGTENIHLHGIIWTDNIEEIEQHWQYGYVWKGYQDSTGKFINYVNEQTVNYITKYITKVDFDHKYYKSLVLTSAGIGKGYMERADVQRNKYNPLETKEYYVNRQGFKFALPIYWRNKIYSEQEREMLWIEKLNKEERFILGHKIDISQSEENYWKALFEAREKNERLGYGGQHTDWERKHYEEQRRTLLQKQRCNNIKDTLPIGAKSELYTQSNKAYHGLTPNTNF